MVGGLGGLVGGLRLFRSGLEGYKFLIECDSVGDPIRDDRAEGTVRNVGRCRPSSALASVIGRALELGREPTTALLGYLTLEFLLGMLRSITVLCFGILPPSTSYRSSSSSLSIPAALAFSSSLVGFSPSFVVFRRLTRKSAPKAKTNMSSVTPIPAPTSWVVVNFALLHSR